MLKIAVVLLIVGGAFLFTNTNGMFFGSGDKCHIAVHKGGKEFGGEKLTANKSFVPFIKSIGAVAKGCKVKVHVIDSYKQLKSADEFVLSREMPLALGRGFHFILENPKGGTLCNKLCMVGRSWKTLPDAKCFIDGLTKKGIKFTEPDLIDDGTTAKLTTAQADALKIATQKLCAPKPKAPKG